MAKALARSIGYRYIDSGAMYRAVTLYAMRNGLISADGKVDIAAITAALPSIIIDFKVDGERQVTLLNGVNVEDEIRQLPVSNNVSPVAAIPEVRHHLVALQQAFGKDKGIVMDGRDIGTCVLTDADVKVYLTASVEVRAKRRYLELSEKGISCDFEQIAKDIEIRDRQDMTREISPLKQAEDAVLVDSSDMTIDEAVEAIIDICKMNQL